MTAATHRFCCISYSCPQEHMVMGELGPEIISCSTTWQTVIGMKGKGLEG